MKSNFSFNLLLQYAFLVLVLFSSCRSYKPISKGYLVHGDEHFVNIDESFTVFLGPELLTNSSWELDSPPFQARRISRKQSKLLNHLAYKKNSHSIVFVSDEKLPYELIGVVNKQPDSIVKREFEFDLSRLEQKEVGNEMWYEEISEINDKQVYHAVIPISEVENAEQYLSLIFTSNSSELSIDNMKQLAQMNASLYLYSQHYIPAKTVMTCPHGEESSYYDFTTPDIVMEQGDYTLIKAFENRDKNNLAYYSLLNQDVKMGSFKLCPGEYLIEYSTLSGKLLWSEELDLKKTRIGDRN